MKLTDEESKAMHRHTFKNMDEISRSDKCGCISCCQIYRAAEIEESIPDGDGRTALCVNCGVDAVIGDASGIEITPELLKVLNKKWF